MDRLWVLGQMAAARLGLRQQPEIGFWKLFGSGTGEGFTPRPNWGVWAILATWPDLAKAREGTTKGDVFERWRHRASESWTLYMSPQSARGYWSGQRPFVAVPAPETGALAVLTRATLRPQKLLKFWQRVPAISSVIGADPNVIFKIGVGEVPLLHQVTFSIWPDARSITEFARGNGPHGRAVRAVREEGWFREELYARFAVLESEGEWFGRNPLVQTEVTQLQEAQ
jgi:spheroidene monooxygenase